MKSLYFALLLTAAAMLASPNANAWGCADGESRINVGTSKPAGTSGDGPDQWFLGTGSEGIKGDYYVCPNPNPPAKPTTTHQGQTQTQGQQQTANGGNSSSKSNSSSNATGGSVNNSGNSSNRNTNTNVANGGQGGSASAAANNNATGSGNTTEVGGSTYTTRVEAAAATADAFANSVYDCTKGVGAGAQTIAAGATFSFGHADGTCQDLKIAESLYRTGSDAGYCTALSHDKQAKKLGITFEICMTRRAPKVVVIQAPPVAVAAPVPTINVFIPPAPTPIASVPVVRHNPGIPVGQCVVLTHVDNVCTQFLGTTARQLNGDVDGYVIVKGNGQTVSLISNWLDKHQHVNHQRYHLSVTDDPSATVQFTFVSSNQEQASN